jgi:hypothetical protein
MSRLPGGSAGIESIAAPSAALIYRAQFGQCGRPTRAKAAGGIVDLGLRADGGRGLRFARFWSIAIAGEASMWSTSGFSIWPRNWRA